MQTKRRPFSSFLFMLVDEWHYRRSRIQVFAVLIICLLLAGGGVFVYLTGGTQFAYLHVMYIPIVLAAFLFKLPGGLLTAVLAGLIVGPIMPLDVAAGTPQPLLGWLYRIGFFLLTGFTAAVLAEAADYRLQLLERLADRLSVTYAKTLKTQSSLVELRDEQTAGHCERVAHNAQTVGEALNLGSREIEALYWAGLLHDLGKIAIPEQILLKPGKLTAEEFAIVKTHAAIGADILISISSDFDRIADAVRSHHERWDGTGYPTGLAGEEIPILGRILAIVDVFEALTSDRPYRKAWSPGEAIAHIQESSGAHFEPAIVDVFVRLYQEDTLVVSTMPEVDAPPKFPVHFARERIHQEFLSDPQAA